MKTHTKVPAQATPSTNSRKGRRPNTLCEYTRAMVWAPLVVRRSGKSLTELERDYIADTFPARAKKPQPQAWTKYASGELTPTPPGSNKPSPVTWAEGIYPGTRAAYDSVVWQMLDMYHAGVCIDAAWPMLVDKIDPKVLHEIDADNWLASGLMLPRLSTAGFLSALDNPHLDAFAILLYQVLRSPTYEPPTKPLIYATHWLQRWSRVAGQEPKRRRARARFLVLLGTYVSEFSFLLTRSLHGGCGGAGLAKVENRRLQNGLRRLVRTVDPGRASQIAAGLLDDTFLGGAVGDEYANDDHWYQATASESLECGSFFVTDALSGSVFEIPPPRFGKGSALTSNF